MEQSLQYELIAPRPKRWARAPVQAAVGEGSSLAFKLLVLFIIILYSNVAVQYKQLNVVRPALTVALAGLGLLIVEMAQSRRQFRFMWPQGVLLLTFLAVAFISSFDAMWPRLGFERTSDIGKIVLIYILIENTVTSRGRLHRILLTMVLGGLIPAFGTINNYLHGIMREGRAAWVGVFANPNEAAYSFVILMPLAAALAVKSGWWMRVILTGAIGVYLIAMFVTYSRGSLLGLFAIVAIAGWKQKSMVIRAVIVVGLIGGLMLVPLYWQRDAGFTDISKDTTYNQRIATIKAGWRMFEARPLLGVGPGCSVVAYPIYVPPESHCGCQLQLAIHNTFVQALSEVGLLGFVPFMLFLGLTMFDAWKLQKGPLSTYAAALEVALWGFVVCSISGGYSYSWWPYILIALVIAAKHMAASTLEEEPNEAAA